MSKKHLRPNFVSQKEILESVRFTDTFESLDTLTVTKDLVADSDRFFLLCEKSVGSNFLRVPLTFKREDGKFVCGTSLWFTPHKPTSIAEWLLFYLERAIWI